MRLSERKLNKIIYESIRRTLNEKWYPEDGDDISDYSFGMIAQLSTRNVFELDEDAIAKLESIKDVQLDGDYDSYVSVMIRKVKVSPCYDYDFCSATIECAVSAPDMPTDEIESEVEDQLWSWFENETGTRLASGFEWESERTVFDRRVKNK